MAGDLSVLWVKVCGIHIRVGCLVGGEEFCILEEKVINMTNSKLSFCKNLGLIGSLILVVLCEDDCLMIHRMLLSISGLCSLGVTSSLLSPDVINAPRGKK